MPRPPHSHPTPGELEVLQVLWKQQPRSVREVMEELNLKRERAYTSVMSLMNTMTDKGLLIRKAQGRAYLYEAPEDREKTIAGMACDLLNRAFDGSASSLVANLLSQAKPSREELAAIQRAIADYQTSQTVRKPETEFKP